ncbi:MAG TPA: DUF1702 family protein [Thermoanaerobaculia bacterium]|nr:DUF1702 family protein [Thermoanaerobaculia bacterium]
MWKRLLRIPPDATSPSVRGFAVDSPARAEHLAEIGRTFLFGYHAALAAPRAEAPAALAARLQAGTAPGRRGFAFEGAAMALALLDYLSLSPGSSRAGRLGSFLEGPAWSHRYLVHVGVGWTLARVPRRLGPLLRRFEPSFRWLVVDGYGFHHGYFGWPRAVGRQAVPRRLRGYARSAFDQGLGRSLWFVCGASPERIATTVAAFDEARRGDLWSGVGLACAYAGGVGPEAVAQLGELAGGWLPDLAQGAAFAATARQAADDPAPDTELACRVLCGLDPAQAAELTDRAGERAAAAAGDAATPLYERWRRQTRRLLPPKGAVA